MRPRERRDGGEQDLFRARLDQIIDIDHALAKLARAIDWRFLEDKFGAAYTEEAGRPPLPTRLMAGLAILKHTFNLSDEAVCERWIENPYYQYLCGETFFQHALPLDRSSITRWRNRMGAERLEALLQESLSVATRTGAMKPSDLSRVIVDTTVQPRTSPFRPTENSSTGRATSSSNSRRGAASSCVSPTNALANSRSLRTNAMLMPGSSSAPIARCASSRLISAGSSAMSRAS